MSKIDVPSKPVGECKYCTINLYQFPNGERKPAIFPCGINRVEILDREEKKIAKKDLPFRCPWETEEEQARLSVVEEHEIIAGLLNTNFSAGLDD